MRWFRLSTLVLGRHNEYNVILKDVKIDSETASMLGNSPRYFKDDVSIQNNNAQLDSLP